MFLGIINNMDLLYLVETSKQTTDDTLKEVTDLISKDLPTYKLSSSGSRIGIVAFAAKPNIILALSNGISAENVNDSLENIQISDTNADIEQVLNYVRNSFNWEDSGRKSTPKVVVLFSTSVKGEFPTSLASSANRLKEIAKVVVVGVGEGLNENELGKIATDKEPSIIAEKPEDLSDLIAKINQRIAESTRK